MVRCSRSGQTTGKCSSLETLQFRRIPESICKTNWVRWSELLRLPYFDPVRFATVDPMHCLFLGIAKWIVKRIWVDEEILTTNTLKMVQKKMDEFQIPSDLG